MQEGTEHDAASAFRPHGWTVETHILNMKSVLWKILLNIEFTLEFSVQESSILIHDVEINEQKLKPSIPSPLPVLDRPSTINTMSDKVAPLTPSTAPPIPSGPRPKVTNRGRSAVPIASSNSDSKEVPEFEPFSAPGPRGFPPLTGEGCHG